MANLGHFPAKLLKSCLAHVHGNQNERSSHFSQPVQLAAGLLGLAKSTVRAAFDRARKNRWRPEQRASTTEKAANKKLVPNQKGDGLEHADPLKVEGERHERTPMENIVSTALADASEGRSGQAFERDLCRLRLSGGNIGQSLHSRKLLGSAQFHNFVFICEHVAVPCGGATLHKISKTN